MNLNLDPKVDKIDIGFTEKDCVGVRCKTWRISPPANLSIESLFIAMALQTIYSNVLHDSLPQLLLEKYVGLVLSIDTRGTERQTRPETVCGAWTYQSMISHLYIRN